MHVFSVLALAIIGAVATASLYFGQPMAVLPGAAALTLLLGIGHSVLGERRLIQPILALDGLPRLFGSVAQTRAIVRFAWHLTSLLWFGLAALMAYMSLVPGSANKAVLWMIAIVFALSGIAPVVMTRGAHKSWIYFFSIAALAACAAIA